MHLRFRGLGLKGSQLKVQYSEFWGPGFVWRLKVQCLGSRRFMDKYIRRQVTCGYVMSII